MEGTAAEAVERVVLVGFMCSGKTRVGRELAARLGWEQVDLDREIEARAGMRVAEIFARHGEPRFRELEAEATERVADRRRIVLSSGGGWITRPELLDRLGAGTLSVWLRVSPEQVLARSAASPGERPLLATPDPLASIHRLLAERERFYSLAQLALSTDGRRPSEIVQRIESEIHRRETRSGALPAPP
ncbi:MAG: shikimate kinase [Gemmatimonadetes bacterium]|nr:shikimate kinase [Gemmatimonadota bacterium]